MSLACGYTYEETDAVLTTMVVDGTAVTIMGENLPLELVSFTLGYVDCAVGTNDETQITCTLEYPLIAGSWKPEIKDSKGLIGTCSDTCEAVTVPLAVTSVQPSSGLNPAGGDTIVIAGEGFPSMTTLGDDVLALTFDDGTICDLTLSTPTEMQCQTRAFTPDTEGSLQRFFLVAFSDLEEQTEVILNSDPTTVASIEPSSASPILMETLVIQLGAGYDNTGMDDDTFSVYLVPQDGGDTRQLNVVEIDSDNLRLTLKYGGAYSGVYDLEVKSEIHGFLDTAGVTFEAKIEVTDFSPKQGSLYGGTLVTITGGHFSDKITDNPVKIDYEWVGGVDHYCYVQSSSDSEIVCRMATDYKREAGDAEVIVFASTFEEATWADGVDKMFTFLDADSIPTVTSWSVEFTSENVYQVTIEGADITDADVSTVDVFFGGVEQEVVSVGPTQLVVKVVGL